ncbi:MAG TPA: DMT family transporter [Motilibacteraceae bacterium]|nr:DMT family transporter [Motilibacteraceae bacterium]
MVPGLVGALAASLCYGLATVLQALAARRAVGPSAGTGGLAATVVDVRYLAGLVLDGAGFAASVVALRTLPLFLVQAAVTSSVGVTAVLAVRFLGARLRRRELLTLLLLGAGLLLLAASARPERALPLPVVGGWVVLAAGLVVGAGCLLAARAGGRAAGPACAAGAGLAFGGAALAARALTVPHPLWRVVTDPLAWALAVHGVVGTLAYAAALLRTAATTVAAVTFAVETVVPAALGLALLGDSVRAGTAPLAALGFALAVTASVLLARFAEPA